MIVNKTDEEALQNFLLDIQCLDDLRPWTDKFNLFDVLKISRAEIRHSNMLAWLLAPSENHEIGDSFLRGIIQKLVEKDSEGRYDVFHLLLLDTYSFSVCREWKNIDLLLVSDKEKIAIAIENKVGAHEHSNQLNRYRSAMEKEYIGYNTICIFLTPDGEEPSDPEHWDTLTYWDIVDVLEKISSVQGLRPDVKVMVDNYLDIVRRDIVEDKELVDICNQIYNKHKRALDLIYENKIDTKNQQTVLMKQSLMELSDEDKIIYDTDSTNTCLSFYTEGMDSVLPPLKSGSTGSWGTKNVYKYWITPQKEGFLLYFELGGWNVPEDEMEIMQQMIEKLKPADKRRSEFRYKRLYKTTWKISEDADDFEQEVRKQIRRAVKNLLKWENELLGSLCIK